MIQEARRDAELRRWFDWLAVLPTHAAQDGPWYLRQLEIEAKSSQDATIFATTETDGASGTAKPLPDARKRQANQESPR